MNNNFGVTPYSWGEIVNTLKSFPEIKEAYLIGSRAKGNYKTGSDIDIVIKGENLFEIKLKMSGILNEEKPIPYHVDILDYETLENEALREHIDSVGIKIK